MKENIIITNRIFEEPGFTEFDYAVLIAVSMEKGFEVVEKKTHKEFQTHYFSLSSIAARLNLKLTRDKKTIISNIFNTLQKLKEARFIDFETKKLADREDVYKATIIIEKDGIGKGFTQLLYKDVEEINTTILKDSEKFKALACYAVINQRIYTVKRKSSKESSFNWVNEDERFLNFDTLDTIGSKYGRSRKSATSSLKILNDLKVIKYWLVRLRDKHYKYISCRYEDRSHLSDYVAEKINDGYYLSVVEN